MIINIRGTSGSGKSTIVRALMDSFEEREPLVQSGRRQPIGYLCAGPYLASSPAALTLAVVGHYETACGGCDTISKMDEIFGLVRDYHDRATHVVFEGLLISADVNRTLALHEDGFPLFVVALDKVPLEVCLASVNERRLARMGPERYTPVKEKNTISKFRGVQQSMTRLAAARVDVASHGRKTALAAIVERLGI